MTPRSSDELFERVRFRGEPIAHARSVVIHGDARFTVLTSRLIRMEWSATGEFDDRSSYAFPTRYTTPPAFATRREGDQLVVDTGALTLRHRGGGRFSRESLSIELAVGAERRVWVPGMQDPANLRGTRRTLDGCAGDAALEEGVLSRSGWALFDDSRSVRFDPRDGWAVSPPDHELQDWYFFGYGHDYQAALGDYVRLGGHVPLIPRYALGAWWSRYWAYRAEELQEVVRGFEAHGLPLDVLVVDMDWHTPHAWTGYTWNRELFPDPPAFLQWAHDKGLRVTLNLHPAQGVQPFEQVYPVFAEAMGVEKPGEAIPFRIGDRAFVRNYFELLHHPLEEEGVDFWWVDWQQGEMSDLPGLDPLPWLNHLHFADSARRGRRPMLYSRWGGLGNHRYPIGFSGDTYATWTALQFQPHMTATAANVAFGWWSHDIGGHMGGATEPELYARWVQFGALSPCLRLHATKDSRAERRPWAYPEAVYQAARAAFQWRYRLVPLLYTLARVAHDTGVSPCRPMYYAYPEHEAAYVARYQYLLGEGMLAAPIVHPADPETGLAATDVWVPEGTWIDVSTLETFQGPRWARLVGGLERMPMLVRAGGILPLAAPFEQPCPPRMASGTTDALPHDRLVVSVFPGAAGSFRLYEDDGLTEGYRDGQFQWTPMRARMKGPTLWEVQIGPVEGRCDALPQKRGYEVRLEGSRRPDSVWIDGEAAPDWEYDAGVLRTTIQVPARGKDQPVRVSALAKDGLSALGEVRNQRLAQMDVKRLLREQVPETEDGEAFLKAVLQADGPGRADAVARLGGPLVRVIEFSAPEEAAQRLGRVIIGASNQADHPYNLEAVWRLEREGETLEQTLRVPLTSESAILDAPFGWQGWVQPARWSVDVRLRWRGETLRHVHRSQPLFPTIPVWRGVILDGGRAALPLEAVMGGGGKPNLNLDWQPYLQEASMLENLTKPHWVRLSTRNRPALESRAAVAYLATLVRSSDVREAVVEFHSAGPVQLFLNGEAVAVTPIGEESGVIQPSSRPARRTEAVRLRAGENYLLAVVRPHSTEPVWLFQAALLTSAGEVMTDLTYR